jgi:hypothetical protein
MELFVGGEEVMWCFFKISSRYLSLYLIDVAFKNPPKSMLPSISPK